MGSCWKWKNCNFILVTLVIQGFFLAFEATLFGENMGVTDYAELFLSMIIMYIVSFTSMYLVSLGDRVSNLYNLEVELERDKNIKNSLFKLTHEIKNPLTPMRLTVQSFQRKFDPNDPNITQKLDDYTKTILQQIDTMTAVAGAFSNFATMPAQQNETLNVVRIVKMALEIFNEDYIQFSALEDEIIAKLDRTQLIRVITNLVKNAIQAIPEEQENKLVFVTVFRQDNEVKIAVKDNGKGISKENQERVFEPKFTTKSSGMGLGLAIIKNIIENYNGTITFETEPNVGTEFLVSFPINK